MEKFRNWNKGTLRNGWEHYIMVLQSYTAVCYFSQDLYCNYGEGNI